MKFDEQFDIVIWGATSFAGQYITEHLVKRYANEYRIAIAGRDSTKLEQLKTTLKLEDIDTLVGNANDELFLQQLTSQTKLVISTVGPYALYGEPLIKACVESGIDYCDLTGEPQWIWSMLEKYEQKAKETGARILNCCGFDSIPSDLGVHHLQESAKQVSGQYCEQIHYRFKSSKGGFSGGTVATMLNAIEQITNDKDKARLLKTPYALIGNKPEGLPFQYAVKGLEKDTDSGRYLVPFIMASINTKIVHRTNALSGYKWGTSFLYDESMQFQTGFKGWLQGAKVMSGLAIFGLLAATTKGQKFLKRFIVPKTGEGPSEELVRNGFFNVELIGKVNASDGVTKTLTMKVTGQGDPGYGSTSKMISETAILLLETDSCKTGVGFLTPAAALGETLVERLVERAELEFKLNP